MLGGLPQSAPGTILGIPVSKLRDAGLQRQILFLAGIALIASIVVPISISPLVFPFSGDNPFGFWMMTLFPIIAGAAYLLVAAAPPNLRQQIPPAVIQWIPFGISYWGVLTTGPLILGGMLAIFAALAGVGGGAGGSGIHAFAYVILVFGLLCRIAKPTDQTARVVIAIGGGLHIIPLLSMIGPAFSFGGGVFFIVIALLQFLVVVLSVFCVVFVLPPQKLPPALQTVDAFGPIICAALLAWPVLLAVLNLVGGIIHIGDIVGNLLMFVRVLLYIVAFLAVLLMASPNVYEAMFAEPVMKRKPLGTLLLMLVPLFGVYWLVETKNEIQKRTGMQLISGWWIAVPFGSIYFLWKWSQGVEKATGFKQMNAFLFMMFIAPYGVWVIQQKFNELEGGASQPPQPAYAAAGGGGYPPPGGGYPPPQGGGYPPQGGGYPPPGGGYPA